MKNVIAILAVALSANAFAADNAVVEMGKAIVTPIGKAAGEFDNKPMQWAGEQAKGAHSALEQGKPFRAARKTVQAAGGAAVGLAVGAVHAAGDLAMGAINVAKLAVEDVIKTGTYCTMDYTLDEVQLGVLGWGSGRGTITCTNGFGKSTSEVVLKKLRVGPGLELVNKSGQFNFYGAGTSTDVIVGLFANAEINFNLCDKPFSAEAMAGVTAGSTGLQALAGYSYTENLSIKGPGSATVGLTLMVDRGVAAAVEKAHNDLFHVQQ